MKIGIIGIGLIGASLAHDFCAAQTGEIHIFDKNPDHLRVARELRIGTHWHEDVAELGRACDVVFLCVPVRRMAEAAAEVLPHMRTGSILTDVGSVKEFVVDAITPIVPDGIHFVPGHPAAGLEYSGPAAGIPGLFANKTYVLCPDEQTDPDAVKTIAYLISGNTGANILKLNAKTHDRVFGYTSHMPHILTFAAMTCAPAVSDHVGTNVLPFAGTTYRDFTRVANANAIMWRDIFLTNKQSILDNLDVYLAEVEKLRDMVTRSDAEGMFDYITRSGQLRGDMDQKFGSPGPSLPTPPPGKK